MVLPCASSLAGVTGVQRYAIGPGGEYTYLPSPKGPGIGGGMPSAHELEERVEDWFEVRLFVQQPVLGPC